MRTLRLVLSNLTLGRPVCIEAGAGAALTYLPPLHLSTLLTEVEKNRNAVNASLLFLSERADR